MPFGPVAASTPSPAGLRARSNTISSELVQTLRGSSVPSNTRTSDEYPPRGDPRDGASRAEDTDTETSARGLSSSSPGGAPVFGALPAGSTEGTEMGSLAPDEVSAAAAMDTHTRPARSAAIAVTSGLDES